MLRKYNIALIPENESQKIIACSNHFSGISDQYRLGNESLPHVTLCQFEFEVSKIDQLWEEICNQAKESSIKLEFNHFSCVTFDQNIFWISLMPDKRDVLTDLHVFIKNKLNVASKKEYDPHLTLINTKNSFYERMVNDFKKSYSPISDNFVLAVGECDAIGQFTKVVHKCDFKKKLACDF